MARHYISHSPRRFNRDKLLMNPRRSSFCTLRGYGFLATIEKQILRGEGSVDLSLEKQDIFIACEISVTSTPEHELHNVEKCFAAGFQEVILLAPEKKRLDKLRTYIIS